MNQQIKVKINKQTHEAQQHYGDGCIGMVLIAFVHFPCFLLQIDPQEPGEKMKHQKKQLRVACNSTTNKTPSIMRKNRQEDVMGTVFCSAHSGFKMFFHKMFEHIQCQTYLSILCSNRFCTHTHNTMPKNYSEPLHVCKVFCTVYCKRKKQNYYRITNKICWC